MIGRSGRLTLSASGPESLGASSVDAFPFGGCTRVHLSPDSQSMSQSSYLRVPGVVALSAPGAVYVCVELDLFYGMLQLSLVFQLRLRAVGTDSGGECVMGREARQVGLHPVRRAACHLSDRRHHGLAPARR